MPMSLSLNCSVYQIRIPELSTIPASPAGFCICSRQKQCTLECVMIVEGTGDGILNVIMDLQQRVLEIGISAEW